LKIQALKYEKITWPADNFGTDIWVLTVDGVHVRTNEPVHSIFSFHPDYFSFKYGNAGLSYEIGVAIARQKVVWMNGPFYPGELNDIGAFVKKGLKAKLEETNK
jgi:hypothetical protein